MTIDRTALRRIADKYRDSKWQGMGTELLVGLDAAIIELDAKDRRIAELEAACQSARSGAAEAVAAHDVSKDLFSMVCSERDDALLRLSIATELNVGDRKRIAELEAGLREALDWWAPADGDDVAMGVWFKLGKLCLYEETRNQEVEDCEPSDLLPSEET